MNSSTKETFLGITLYSRNKEILHKPYENCKQKIKDVICKQLLSRIFVVFSIKSFSWKRPLLLLYSPQNIRFQNIRQALKTFKTSSFFIYSKTNWIESNKLLFWNQIDVFILVPFLMRLWNSLTESVSRIPSVKSLMFSWRSDGCAPVQILKSS